MAEEQVIINVEINNDEAKKRTVALTQEIEKQRQELAKYRKILKDSGGENEEAAKKVAMLSESIKENNLNLRRAQKQAKAEINSINALRASIIELNDERNKINTSTEIGQKRFMSLTKELKIQRDKMNELSLSSGSFKDNIGNYTESVKKAFKETRVFGVSIQGLETVFNQARAALTTSIRSLGLFKVALIATGVGAFAIVLGSVVTFLTKSQKGIDLVNQKLAGLRAIVSVVTDGVIKLGEGIVNFVQGLDLSKVTLDGFIEFASSLFKSFVDTQIKIFTALKDVIVGAITFDEEQIQKGADSFVELFNRATAGISEEVKRISEEAKKAAQAAEVIEKERQRLRDREIKFITQRAILDREIAKQREIAADQENDAITRANALERSIELVNQKSQIEISLRRQKLALLDREQALSSNLAEDNRERAELAAEIIQLETDAANQRRESLSQLSGIRKAERIKEEKEIEALANNLNKLREEETIKIEEEQQKRTAIIEEEERKRLDAQIRALDEANDRESVLAEARKRRFEEEESARNQLLGATNEFFQDTTKFAAEAFGEQSFAARAAFAIQKNIARAQIIIAGVTEVQEIFKSFAGLGPIGQILGAIRAGVSVARTAVAVQNVDSTGFSIGGYTGDGGRLQPAGVVHKGEFVVNKHNVKKLGGPRKVARLTGQAMNTTSKSFQSGGFAASEIENSVNSTARIDKVAQAVSEMKFFVAVTDINKGQDKRQKVVNIADQ